MQRWARKRLRVGGALVALMVVLGPGAAASSAATPTVGQMWVSAVQSTTARLNAEIDPGGKTSTYRFDYITEAAYKANVAASKDPFAGTARLPVLADALISGTVPTTISPLLFGLTPDTAYRYRLIVKNADGQATSPTHDLATFAAAPFALPDGRGWELVSPVEKNGGQIEAPGVLAGGGVLQSAADGQSVTYGSDASFADGAGGAPPASQYLSARAAGDWSTQNITPATISGSYGSGEDGVPYQLFSTDLARGLMLNGRPCRGEATGCPIANPPLAGTDAPPGYQNYYLRESGGGFEALLGPAELSHTDIDPADFELAFSGASLDLKHVVLSSCAALTADSLEVPLGEGCDPAKPNLYRISTGTLTLINTLPGAELAAPGGAVSATGSRVYWTDLNTGNLFLREGATTKQVDLLAGGGGTFETATSDGAIALFTKGGHLWRYEAVADTALDLTPAGGVLGVLGASANASHVYYLTAAGIFLREGAVSTKVAEAADASNYPPATGAARVSADGSKLLFVSTTALTTSDGHTYDNTDLNTKAPDSEVYLYDDAGAGTLSCLSCNPTHARPLGPSTVPGAIANGTTPGSTQAYKPRVLSTDGKRVFFDSEDALVLADVNLDTDVYQWEAQGKGSCARPGGCISLISSGLANRASFVDASTDGADAFFLTDRSLVARDPGSIDLYDARIGGGFPEPPEPNPCLGDACQAIPPAVEDPALTTVLPGPGNPAERYRQIGRPPTKKCPKGKKLRSVKTKSGKRVKRCLKVEAKRGSRR